MRQRVQRPDFGATCGRCVVQQLGGKRVVRICDGASAVVGGGGGGGLLVVVVFWWWRFVNGGRRQGEVLLVLCECGVHMSVDRCRTGRVSVGGAVAGELVGHRAAESLDADAVAHVRCESDEPMLLRRIGQIVGADLCGGDWAEW